MVDGEASRLNNTQLGSWWLLGEATGLNARLGNWKLPGVLNLKPCFFVDFLLTSSLTSIEFERAHSNKSAQHLILSVIDRS